MIDVMPPTSGISTRWLNPALLLLTAPFAIFILCATGLVHVGYPSRWLYRQLAELNLIPSIHPFSGSIVRVFDQIAPSAVSLSASLMNVVLAVIGLTFFYRLLKKIPLHASEQDTRTWMSRWAALTGTAMLAISPGFWWAATRPGPGMISFVLLTGSVWHLTRFTEQNRRHHLVWASSLLGLGVWDSPFIAVASPALLLINVALAYRAPDREQRVSAIWPLAGFVAGTTVGILLMYMHWNGTYLASISPSRWHWFAEMLTAWKKESAIALFPFGWLAIAGSIVAFTSLSLYAAVPARKRIHRRTRWIQRICFIGLMITFFIDPAHIELLYAGSVPMLMPWVFLSISFGITLSFIARPWVEKNRSLTNVVLVNITVVLCSIAVVIRFPAFSSHPNRILQPVWDAMLSRIETQDWIVSDGQFDAPLWLTAHQKGRDPVMLHPGWEYLTRYRLLLARRFDDPRWHSLATVGTGALIAERLRGPGVTHRGLLSFGRFQPLVFAGFEAFPRLGRYEPFAPGTSPVFNEWIQQHREEWLPVIKRLGGETLPGNEAKNTVEALHHYASRLANDLGVILDQHERPTDAALCYRDALLLRPDNLSARINLAAHESPGQLPAEVLDALQARCQPDLIATLANDNGLLMDRRTIRLVEELCPWRDEADEPPLPLGPIIAQRLAGETNEAYEAVSELTRQHPEARSAWILRAVFAHERGDQVVVDQAISLMKQKDESWAPLLMILGEQAIREERFDEAYRHFSEALNRWPFHVRTLEYLVQLDLHLKTKREREDHVRRLLSIDPWNPWGNFALGLDLVTAGDFTAAETALLAAISRQPLPVAANNLAWLLLKRGDLPGALMYARKAINLEPYGAAQWDTMASILIEQQAWPAAGVALQTALRLDPDSIPSAVHYAYWKKQTGDLLIEGDDRLKNFDPATIPEDERLQRLWREVAAD